MHVRKLVLLRYHCYDMCKGNLLDPQVRCQVEKKTEPQLSLASQSFESPFITLYPENTVLNKKI